MEVRNACVNDVDLGLLELYIECFKIHYNERKDVFFYKSKSDLKDELLRKIDYSFVMEKDGLIIGFISYDIKESVNRVLWINDLIVSKKYRRMGYGRKLINKIKDIANLNNCKRIEFYCWNFNDANEFYKHLNFEVQKVVYEINL